MINHMLVYYFPVCNIDLHTHCDVVVCLALCFIFSLFRSLGRLSVYMLWAIVSLSDNRKWQYYNTVYSRSQLSVWNK